MALKANQIQVTTNRARANSINERIQKVVNDMLRPFDSENIHENLDQVNPLL
jgi:hypothetical protein